MNKRMFLIVAVLVWFPCAAQAQDVASWTVEVGQNYRLVPDVTYLVAGEHRAIVSLPVDAT